MAGTINNVNTCSPEMFLLLTDLFITTRGEGNVEVKKMECDVCEVQTERGSCLLHSVKVGV